MNEDNKPEYIAIDPNEEIGGSAAVEYEPLEVGDIYQGYISEVRRVNGTDFDGNPNIQLVFGIKKQGEPGEGQVYSLYATESLHEKAKLSGFLKAVLGEVRKFKVAEILGLPLQFTVRQGKTEASKHRQMIDQALKAAKDQKRVVVTNDVAPADLAEDPVAALEKAMDITGAEKV